MKNNEDMLIDGEKILVDDFSFLVKEAEVKGDTSIDKIEEVND